jgi:lysophospholipase L1-like esterase
MDRSALWKPLAWLTATALVGCAPALAARTTPVPREGVPREGVTDENGDGRTVVACLGDSNTDPVFNRRLAGGSWCERLARSHGPTAEFHNFGAGGGTVACDFPLAVSLALHQLDDAIAAGADAIVLAFVTNDVRYALRGACPSLDPARRESGLAIAPEQIEGEVLRRTNELVRKDRSAHFWILLAPPALPPEGDALNPKILATNQRLERRYAKSRRVDVIAHPPLLPEDYTDSLHMSASGQEKRARAVGAAMFGR